MRFRKFHRFLKFAIVSFAAGLCLQRFMHSDYAQLAGTFLTGLSIVLMIAGLFMNRRCSGSYPGAVQRP
jgi:phosphate starvation-inducible membrane PsiE